MRLKFVALFFSLVSSLFSVLSSLSSLFSLVSLLYHGTTSVDSLWKEEGGGTVDMPGGDREFPGGWGGDREMPRGTTAGVDHYGKNGH